MEYTARKRFTSWSHRIYGDSPPLGVVSRQALVLNGCEGSHLGDGWYPTENGFRWTKQQASAYVHRFRGQNCLELELWTGPRQLGSVQVNVNVGGVVFKPRLHGPLWHHIKLSLPPLKIEQCITPITITVDHTRNPWELGTGDNRELGVAVRLLELKGVPQTTKLPLSSVCNPDHWSNPFWQQCLHSMNFTSPFGAIRPDIQHRKLWEWVHGMSGLVRLGCLTPSAIALGVAAGHEPVIYWLASRVAHVYATDLYNGVFVGHEADPDVLYDPDKYAPYPYPKERVHFLPMSGTDICFGNETVDCIFSFCSIEHFGGRDKSRQSLQEMARVLRPGGIAAVSTEVLINDVAPQPEIFSPWEIYEELIAPSGLLLIGDIAPANLAPFCADPVDISDILTAKPHFVLRDNDILYTSIMLFLQKVH